ncbi:MAG: polysaccharide biosynthesis tyrosine autokinase [Ktedonobacteraceae bacterium]
MTLEQYWATLTKHWRLIIVCFLVVGLGALIGSKLMTRIYQSTALVQIAISLGQTQTDYYNSLLASDQLVQTEATLATSDPVLRAVASHYPGLTVEQLSKEVTATPKVNTQLFEIDVQDPSPIRAAALANDIAQALIRQQSELMQQNTAQGGGFLVIAQPAQPVLNPVQPNTLLNTAAGLMVGLLVGMLLAMLIELLDTHVRTPAALTQLLDWPVLSTIWRAEPKEDVINPTGRNANVEAYRILRTNIGFSSIDKPLHTLMVTSAVHRDGKSVVAANLAIFMAKAGKKTLLIDADLHHPVQHELFGLPADALGFSNAILAFSMPTTAHSLASKQFPAYTTSTGLASTLSIDMFFSAVDIPNLCVMTSGPLPPNASELLESKVMRRVFEAFTISGAEVIIIDTPPLLGLSDASILAPKVDGVIVVANITHTTKKNLKQVKAILTQAGAQVIGSVVNQQRRNRGNTPDYYYYSADNENGRSSQSGESANAIPITPDPLKQPVTQSRPNIFNGRRGE